MERNSSWEGWRENPCSDESLVYLQTLTERLEWMQSLDERYDAGGAYGHSGNITEKLNRVERMQKIRVAIQALTDAQENCSSLEDKIE